MVFRNPNPFKPITEGQKRFLKLGYGDYKYHFSKRMQFETEKDRKAYEQGWERAKQDEAERKGKGKG